MGRDPLRRAGPGQRVTVKEFEIQLAWLGFRRTNMIAGLQRRWIHATGEVRWIMEGQYLLPEKRESYIATVRRSIGFH